MLHEGDEVCDHRHHAGREPLVEGAEEVIEEIEVPLLRSLHREEVEGWAVIRIEDDEAVLDLLQAVETLYQASVAVEDDDRARLVEEAGEERAHGLRLPVSALREEEAVLLET